MCKKTIILVKNNKKDSEKVEEALAMLERIEGYCEEILDYLYTRDMEVQEASRENTSLEEASPNDASPNEYP